VLVSHLSLRDFRSYAELEVDFPGGPQVVVGQNAAGKTNLLEALVVLAEGHSHRTSADAELIRWGTEFARVEAAVGSAVEADAGSDQLEVVLLQPGAPGTRKRVKVNGVPRRPLALASALRAVLFAPEDMLLVVGSPGLRRGVLDRLVVQRIPAAGASLSTYARALSQRNNLLRRIRVEIAAPDELRYWDEVVCVEGGRIVTWRLETLDVLAGPLEASHAEIAPAEERLSLRYLSNASLAADEDPERALRRRLLETAEKEIWNGQTLVGPHRDDLSFQLGGRELSTFASRGQQRTAILALKLAQLDLLAQLDGRPPLLLLDDVFSELDPQRRAHLVRRIGGLPQAFVTTTTLDDLDPALVAASTAWRAEPGRLERISTSNARER
jgi:DNA replication and repair protein RecF